MKRGFCQAYIQAEFLADEAANAISGDSVVRGQVDAHTRRLGPGECGADSSGHAVYCSAGHPPILVRRAERGIEELESLNRPVGLFADTNYKSRELRLECGDCVLLYTDGLVEATGWDDEPFGRQRLRGLLVDNVDGPRKLTQAIYDEIASRQDIDRLEDDVTYLAVEA